MRKVPMWTLARLFHEARLISLRIRRAGRPLLWLQSATTWRFLRFLLDAGANSDLKDHEAIRNRIFPPCSTGRRV